MIGSPRLSALNEDKEHLATTIDKYCQKNLSYYQIQTGIDLLAKARYLLQERNYRLRTNGRRIMAYYSRISDKDEESIRLLKKIAEIDIEDFPPHILQQIKTMMKAAITQAVMEAVINASMLCGNNYDHANKEATRHMLRGSNHNHEKLDTYQNYCSKFKIRLYRIFKLLYK
ncbi:hypothetical protein Gotur_012614 [Gossypium turneri]